MFARDGEVQGARAAQAAGTRLCLSTMSICTIEDVREATSQPFWYQLYMFRDRGFCKAMIERAKAANCSALFVTVDLPMRGQRHMDIKNGLTVPPRLTMRNAFDLAIRPRWIAGRAALAAALVRQRRSLSRGQGQGRSGAVPSGGWANNNYDRTLNWRDIDWVRSIWPGKIVLKGILDVEDAKLAAAAGVDGIVVSNHGGRQLDGARSSIAVAAGDRRRGRRPHRGAVRRRHPLRAGRAQGARARRARLP